MLRPLLAKEFKELVRDPRIWIPFVISALMMPLMGLVIAGPLGEAAKEAQAPVTAGIALLDKSSVSERIVEYATSLGAARGVEFKRVEVERAEEAVRVALELKLDVIVLLPRGFGKSLEEKRRPNVTVILVVESLGFFSFPRSRRAMAVLEDAIASYLIEGSGVSLDLVKNPINEASITYIKPKETLIRGEVESVIGSLAFSSFMLPLVSMIVAVGVIQMAATSTAVENEENTLEVLLSLPVDRFTILLAKLLGSFTVAMIGSSLSILGFIAYFYLFPFLAGLRMGTSIQVLVDWSSLIYIVASLLSTVFFTASIGIVIGALSSDVRIAGTLSGPLAMLVFIPGYYVAFTDTLKLGLLERALLYSVPLTQPVILSKEAIAARLPPETPLYMLCSLSLSLLVVFIASRIFALEVLEKVQRRLSRIKRR